MADPQIPSSFIPKKPNAGGSLSRSGGLFPFLANTLFIITLIASVAVFAYDKYLEQSVAQMNSSLASTRTALEPDVIQQLVDSDKRLNAGKQIIDNHVTLSALFQHLEEQTLQSLRFTSFSYAPDSTGALVLTMKGEARTYASVASQAQVFSQDPDFINPAFGTLDLNDKGNVTFVFTSAVNPKLVSYIASLPPSSSVDTSAGTAPQTQTATSTATTTP